MVMMFGMVIGAMMDARGAEFNVCRTRVGITDGNTVIPDGKADPGYLDECGSVPSPLRGGIEGGGRKVRVLQIVVIAQEHYSVELVCPLTQSFHPHPCPSPQGGGKHALHPAPDPGSPLRFVRDDDANTVQNPLPPAPSRLTAPFNTG